MAISGIRLNPDNGIPIYEQICRVIRSAIDGGDLPHGTPLPTGRDLASALGISRNTVVAAYTQLVAESYLTSNRRQGTRVARVPFGVPVGTSDLETEDFVPAREDRHAGHTVEIGYKARELLRTPSIQPRDIKPFALHVPDHSLYPRHPLTRFLTDELCRSPAADVRNGRYRFQAVLSGYLRRMRGVQCEPSQIVPVSGIDAALDLTARVMIDHGQCILVENPSQPEIQDAFKAFGARVFPLTIDALSTHPAAADHPPPRMILVSPTLGLPLGTQMALERRLQVLELAHRTSAVIFESDPYWELSCSGKLRPLQSLDRNGQVIYFGSMHDTLGPHVRLAYLVVPRHLAGAFKETAERVDYGPEDFMLSAIARFIECNQHAVHAKAVRATYFRRAAAFVEACRAHFPGASVVEHPGGFHVALLFPAGLDEQAVVERASRQGLLVTPLSSFYRAPTTRKGLVLGFGMIPDRSIETMVKRLADIVNAYSAPHGRTAREPDLRMREVSLLS